MEVLLSLLLMCFVSPRQLEQSTARVHNDIYMTWACHLSIFTFSAIEEVEAFAEASILAWCVDQELNCQPLLRSLAVLYSMGYKPSRRARNPRRLGLAGASPLQSGGSTSTCKAVLS
jgi:hypothetical protein